MVRPYSSNETGRKIKNALVELQPEHKQEFEKTLQRLQTKFTDLDDGFKAPVANAKTKEILVSHVSLWLLGTTIRPKTNSYRWNFSF